LALGALLNNTFLVALGCNLGSWLLSWLLALWLLALIWLSLGSWLAALGSWLLALVTLESWLLALGSWLLALEIMALGSGSTEALNLDLGS
jgi:hypothetical protein